MIVFLSNTHDPKDPNASMYVARSSHETQEQAVRNHNEWLKGKIISHPRATRYYTVQQLKEMKLVGVYMQVSFWEWLYRLWKGWL